MPRSCSGSRAEAPSRHARVTLTPGSSFRSSGDFPCPSRVPAQAVTQQLSHAPSVSASRQSRAGRSRGQAAAACPVPQQVPAPLALAAHPAQAAPSRCHPRCWHPPAPSLSPFAAAVDGFDPGRNPPAFPSHATGAPSLLPVIPALLAPVSSSLWSWEARSQLPPRGELAWAWELLLLPHQVSSAAPQKHRLLGTGAESGWGRLGPLCWAPHEAPRVCPGAPICLCHPRALPSLVSWQPAVRQRLWFGAAGAWSCASSVVRARCGCAAGHGVPEGLGVTTPQLETCAAWDK